MFETFNLLFVRDLAPVLCIDPSPTFETLNRTVVFFHVAPYFGTFLLIFESFYSVKVHQLNKYTLKCFSAMDFLIWLDI